LKVEEASRRKKLLTKIAADKTLHHQQSEEVTRAITLRNSHMGKKTRGDNSKVAS